jgi:hypothetical protein
MSQPDPINLLKIKLDEFEHSLKKSCDSYQCNQIDIKTYLMHKENLQSLIQKYKQAILILEV